MSYRDDRDALKARVERLEQELDEARGTVRRLQGETGRVESSSSRMKQTVLQCVVETEPSDAALRAIAELARARLGSTGDTTIVGRELRYRVAGVELNVGPSPGGARVAIVFRFAWRVVAAVLATATAIIATVITGGVAQALGAPRWSALVIILAWSSISGLFWAWRLRRAFEETSAHYRGVLEAAADILAAQPRTDRQLDRPDAEDFLRGDPEAEAHAISESESTSRAARP